MNLSISTSVVLPIGPYTPSLMPQENNREVMEMVREGLVKPALVIGMPVGFVSAVESKDELSKTDIPFITNIGRKGGSPCASAIINALYKLLRQGNN